MGYLTVVSWSKAQILIVIDIKNPESDIAADAEDQRSRVVSH